MVTTTLRRMVSEAGAAGIAFRFVDDSLQVTAPKTPEAAAIMQTMAPHKEAIKAILAQPAQRPPLPRDLWITGIATLAEARDAQRALSPDYVTACGKGVDGWYVACPSSGLTAKAAGHA